MSHPRHSFVPVPKFTVPATPTPELIAEFRAALDAVSVTVLSFRAEYRREARELLGHVRLVLEELDTNRGERSKTTPLLDLLNTYEWLPRWALIRRHRAWEELFVKARKCYPRKSMPAGASS